MRAAALSTLFLCPLLGVLITGCTETSDPGDTSTHDVNLQRKRPTPGEAPFGYVSAEFMPVSEVDATLPMLAAHRVDLALAWPLVETAAERAERFQLVRHAAELGVSIRPWVLLPEADGYWPGATNAELFDREARRFVEEWLEAELAPSMLLVDMEMTLERTKKYVELVGAQDVDGAIDLLRGGVDRARYSAATRTYKELVDFLHERGFRAEISTLSSVLDDYEDGDDGIRQGFSIPIEGIDWDLYTFQVYRTLGEYGLGVRPTSYYVQDYARRARARFGDRAGVIVGMTDAGDIAPDAPVYDSPGEALSDAHVALRTGIAREFVGLYQLRGITRRTPSERWFDGSSSAPALLLPDLGPFLLRTSATVLDSAL